jgi:ABC-type transport system substrate-binding protein
VARIGAKLGTRYLISREIGRGGMGVVYLALDTLLERDVAVKLISSHSMSEGVRERFLREARIIAKLDHAAVLPVYDLGEHEDSLFFVMPYVEGTTLRRLLDEGRASLADALTISAQVARALAHGHEHAVVHRDVKPENVLVDQGPAGLRARLSDFGIAFARTEERLTRSGALVGTPAYMSPEQVAGGTVDGRTDIYALGIVLYECVAGRPPFVGPVQSVLYRIAHEPAPRPSDMGADVEPELEALIMACLTKDPGQRPQDANEIANRLERYQSSIQDAERSHAMLSTMQVSRPKGLAAPALSRLIGRERELGALCRALDAIGTAGCQLAFVSGESGVGKGRLLEEVERLALARGVRVLRGELSEGGQSYPYQGFCELIEQACRTTGSDTPAPDFSDLAGDLVGLFPVLADLPVLRGTRSDTGTRDEEPLGDRTRVFELLSRALGRIAGLGPVVLVLTRLHEADVSVDALAYISRRLSAQPILFLGSYLSSELDRAHPLTRFFESFRGSRRLTRVELGRLSETEHALLVESYLPGGRAGPQLIARLFELTQGNPYFAIELVRSLVDSGSIVRGEDGSWTSSGADPISADALPDTIHKAIEARLSRLSEEEHELLKTASVLGMSFEYRELEEVLEDFETLDAAVDTLVAGGFLHEERHGRVDRLAFGSAIVHGVMYGALPRRTRRRLHARAAEALERVHRGRQESVLGPLLLHYVEADDAEKVRSLGLSLGRSALASFAVEDAMGAAKKVLAFADEDTEEATRAEGEARMLLGEAHRMKGELEPALRELESASRAFARSKAAARASDASVMAVKTAYEARRLVDTARLLERAIPELRGTSDPRLGELLMISATVANLRGDADAAREAAQEVDRLRKESQASATSRGGTLRLAYLARNQVRADSLIAPRNIAELDVFASVVETLVGLDRWGNLSPRLAESWEANADATRFTFTLREGVRFHDGSELTAARVLASIERRMRATDLVLPRAFARLSSKDAIVVAGERRIVFLLDSSIPSYPVLLTDIDTGIVGSETSATLIGTGPFSVRETAKGEVELVSNPQYWGGAPLLDRMEYHTFDTADQIVEAFTSARIDVAMELPVEHVERLLADRRAGAHLLELDRKQVRLIVLNAQRPLGASEAARRALLQSLSIQALVWGHVGPSAQPLSTLIPAGIAGHDPGRQLPRLTIEEARALISEQIPRELRAAASPSVYARYRALFDAIFDHWRELGFDVSLEICEPDSYERRWNFPEGADVFICGWRGDYADAATFTHDLFDSRVGELRAWAASPEVDRLLAQATLESNPDRRAGLYRAADRALVDACLVLPVLSGIDPGVARQEVHALEPTPLQPFMSYERAFLGSAETRQPRRGWLVVPFSEEMSELHPAGEISVEKIALLRCCFEGLTRETTGAEVGPWLAESIESDDGGRTFRVRLRENIRFHDGRKLTAWHVRAAWEQALMGPLRASNVLRFIEGAEDIAAGRAKELKGVTVVSALELSLELTRPIPVYAAMLSDSSAVITSPALDRTRGIDFVGTGPFRFRSVEPSRRIELEANPYYFRPGYPKADGINFLLGVSKEEAAQRFLADQVTFLVDPDDSALGETVTLDVPILSTSAVFFNTRSGVFSDVEQRRAARRAIDPARLAKEYLAGRALPAHSLLPPGMLGHDPTLGDAASPISDTRVERRVKAGLWGIARLFPAYCKALLEDLGKVGFAVESVRLGPGEFVDGLDFVLGSWIADYPDADAMVRLLLHSHDGLIGHLCGHPQIDELAERAGSERDPILRRTLYQRIEELVAEHCLLVPLFHGSRRWLARPGLRGLTAENVGLTDIIDFSELWVER